MDSAGSQSPPSWRTSSTHQGAHPRRYLHLHRRLPSLPLSQNLTPALCRHNAISALRRAFDELGAKIGSSSASYLDATLFEVNVSDFQTSLFSGTNFIVKNVDIRSRGVEIDGAVLAGHNLRLRAAVTYADGINKAPSATERRELVRSPKWSGIAGLNYLHELGPRWSLEADANVEFRSGIYFQDNPLSTVPRSPGFGRVGSRLALNDTQRGLEVALVGRNLTDRRVANYGTGLFPNLPGAYLASSDPPRTIALQFLWKLKQ